MIRPTCWSWKARLYRGDMPWCADRETISNFENVGLNVCMIGESEVGVGESVTFDSGMPVRIWPFTLSFELETVTQVSREEFDSHVGK